MMKNRVQLSFRMVLDGLTGYESDQKRYDIDGNKHGMSGLDYYLKEQLCNGVNFSQHGESLIRAILKVEDSPNSTSLHDAEFYHPLLGHVKLEIRCYKGNGPLHFCHQSEIGGSRCPSKRSDASGERTHLRGHGRTMHKVNMHTHFCFIDISRSPELYISIVPKESILDLWDHGRGKMAIWRDCRINKDPTEAPIFERKPVIRLGINTNQFYKWFYGVKNFTDVIWEPATPYDISQARQDENILRFNNKQGYDIKFPKSQDAPKRITIDERIRNEGVEHDISSDVSETNVNPGLIDMFSPDFKLE